MDANYALRPSWFSSVTHFAALSQLRNYYSNNMKICSWRLVLMSFVIIMLMAAMVVNTPFKVFITLHPQPSAADTFITEHYAICLLKTYDFTKKKFLEASSLTDTVMSIAMLAFGFLSRVMKLSRGISRYFSRFREYVRRRLVAIVKGDGFVLRRVIGAHLYTLLVARPLAVAWILGRLYLELYSSFFFEVCNFCRAPAVIVCRVVRCLIMLQVVWTSFTASWGLRRLLWLRRRGPEDENVWTFGQVAAVVLFIIPLLFMLGNLFGSSESPICFDLFRA